MNTILTVQEVEKLRTQTKGVNHHIHFNNAGSSLPPDVVVDTVVNYLQEEAVFGGYETEFKYRDELENTYTLIARLINAQPSEIAIVENASVGWVLAFNGIDFKAGDVVITSEVEYATNFLSLLHAKNKFGIEIVMIPNDANGNFDIKALKRAISERTRLIAITHIPSSVGVMTPIIEIGKIARERGILYLVDACQTAGQAPIDVKAIQCDILSVTGRKYLRAPRGTGFLFVRQAVQHLIDPFFMDGHSAQWISSTEYTVRSDARRYELYEKSRATTLGLAKAVEYALYVGVDRIWATVQAIATLMRSQLQSIDGVTVHDIGDKKCGIVTFTVNNFDDYAVKAELARQNIYISVSPAASTLIYMKKNNLKTVLRASVHYYNTDQEVFAMCYALGKLIAGFDQDK